MPLILPVALHVFTLSFTMRKLPLKFPFFYLLKPTFLKKNETVVSVYKTKTVQLILLLFLLKYFIAFWLELGNDEAYYWLYSQHLQWNYFDHPPMVALWIRLFSANLLLDQYEGFLRLGSVVGCALSSWFLFKAVAELHSERAGFFAAVLYNASFYSGITAGLYIMPDSPQMVFWTLSLWMIVRITKDPNSWTHWLLFALVSGLCIMSKIHGAFLWIGLGGFVLFHQTSWLKKPQLYLSFLLTVIIIAPIFLWNVRYDFATFRFHSNRIDVDEFVLHWNYFIKEAGNQIGFNNPVNFFLVLFALIAWFRRKIKYQRALAIYNFIGLPLAAMLLLVSLFRNVTLPHWSGPAYVSLMPIASIWLANHSQKIFPKILQWSLGIFVVVYSAYSLFTKLYPGNVGSQQQQNLGRGDISLDMYGWREAAKQFEPLYKNDVAEGIMPRQAPLVTTHWWGAHVEYYFAHPLKLTMIGLGNSQYLNEYLWINKHRVKEVNLNAAYCIIPSDDQYNVPSGFFEHQELAQIIYIKRNGKPAHNFLVYRLRNLKKQVPVIK